MVWVSWCTKYLMRKGSLHAATIGMTSKWLIADDIMVCLVYGTLMDYVRRTSTIVTLCGVLREQRKDDMVALCLRGTLKYMWREQMLWVEVQRRSRRCDVEWGGGSMRCEVEEAKIQKASMGGDRLSLTNESWVGKPIEVVRRIQHQDSHSMSRRMTEASIYSNYDRILSVEWIKETRRCYGGSESR